MKQHLLVFTPNDLVFCKEYMCPCKSHLQFTFKKCLENNASFYSSIPCDNDFADFNKDDVDDVDRTEQVFIKVKEKRTVSENHSYPHVYLIVAGKKVLKGFYLKLVRLTNSCPPTYFSLDEVFDTYVGFSEDLHTDINTCNILIQKANSYI